MINRLAGFILVFLCAIATSLFAIQSRADMGLTGAIIDSNPNIISPATSGNTYTLNNADFTVIVVPTSSIGSLTLTMPVTPKQNQIIIIRIQQAVTSSLTMAPSAGQSISGFTQGISSPVGDTLITFFNGSTWYF